MKTSRSSLWHNKDAPDGALRRTARCAHKEQGTLDLVLDDLAVTASDNGHCIHCTRPDEDVPHFQDPDNLHIPQLRLVVSTLLGPRGLEPTSIAPFVALQSGPVVQEPTITDIHGLSFTKSPCNLPVSPIPGSRTLCLKNKQRVYKTGDALGHGAFSTVRKAVHLATGNMYACKVVSKQSLDARNLARWEIFLLKRLAGSHRNIITLHASFQSVDNFYLIMDLCAGGDLHTRVCGSGCYDERRAARLLRTVLEAVHFLHNKDIVHRDLKPENILLRSSDEDAEIVIADFGLSCIQKGTRRLTRICGTVGYMAPEVFHKVGYGKPVDVWAVGVIAYFVLAGQLPFDRETEEEEVEAIVAGDFSFEPFKQWCKISTTGQDFVRFLLNPDPTARPVAEQALEHSGLTSVLLPCDPF